MVPGILKSRVAIIAAFTMSLTLTSFAQTPATKNACRNVPTHSQLKAALKKALSSSRNGGLNNNMWGTLVNRDEIVCAVAFTGVDRDEQWPGSRVISVQKANTANAFSLPAGVRRGAAGLALSTANLYSAVQPGGSLFGLIESNPVNLPAAYGGDPEFYGQGNDPMVGQRIGGVNVFDGGLALYSADGKVVGGLGVSGDISCTDHIIAWRTRDALGLDHVPTGVSPTGDDNIIIDTAVDSDTGHTVSESGWGHPDCGSKVISDSLPGRFSIGP